VIEVTEAKPFIMNIHQDVRNGTLTEARLNEYIEADRTVLEQQDPDEGLTPLGAATVAGYADEDHENDEYDDGDSGESGDEGYDNALDDGGDDNDSGNNGDGGEGGDANDNGNNGDGGEGGDDSDDWVDEDSDDWVDEDSDPGDPPPRPDNFETEEEKDEAYREILVDWYRHYYPSMTREERGDTIRAQIRKGRREAEDSAEGESDSYDEGDDYDRD